MGTIGHEIKNSIFSLNLNIVKTYSKDLSTEKWIHPEQEFDSLVGRWAILEFSPLTFAPEIFCHIVNIHENGIETDFAINLTNMVLETDSIYYMDSIQDIHILEAPIVSSAKKMITEIATDKVTMSFEPTVAMYAHAIMKLKDKAEDSRISALIAHCYSLLVDIESNTKESDILSDQQSKNFDDDQPKHEKSLKSFLNKISLETTDLEKMPIGEIIEQAHVIEEQSNDDITLDYVYWLDNLFEIRDIQIDKLIRSLYYELSIHFHH